ncbi:MAG: cache domain-containing protein [Candidatus Dadabacteria bacterium]|nr:cache domain-containing protein [Candidatus Dadabacteria bacterium]MDE0477874.1 cache domain-containing protein [Candidatus Dadabacteria bacterium]
MKNIGFLIFLCCVLGFLGALRTLPAAAHEGVPHVLNGKQTELTNTVSDVDRERKVTLEEFVMHAVAHLQEAETFSETLEILNEFRNKEGDWNDGSMYLILLTGKGVEGSGVTSGRDGGSGTAASGGGVYVHAKNRELEDQDWSQLKDRKGINVGQMFLSVGKDGASIDYIGDNADDPPPQAFAFPFTAPAIPFSNSLSPEQQGFVLVGGFAYEPDVVDQKKSYEELAGSLPNSVHPTKEAREIGGEESDEENERELREFVEEAIVFFTAALASPEIDAVRLRTLFRLDGGPWRHVSTYIYIMDENGNVIFNGANRNIEQTNLWDDPDVGENIRELIAAARTPEVDFVRYNWENPAVVGDGEQSGGPGGSSPKLGYTKVVSPDKDDPSAPLYIFGSGLYLGESEEDDGGCALSGTANTAQGALLGLLLASTAVFFLVFLRHGCRAAE